MSAERQLQSKVDNPLAKLEGIEKKRNLRHFPARNTRYTSNNQVEIKIPISTPRELIDFQNSYLIFDIVATGTPTGGSTGTLLFNDWAASAWIREFRIETLAGEQIGKRVSYYNALVRLEYEMKVSNEVASSYLQVLEGAQMNSDATDASVSIQFAHRFISHIFTSEDYFPAFAFEGLQIVILMEDATTVVRAGGDRTAITLPEYSINNLQYGADIIELQDADLRSLKATIQSQGLTVDYQRMFGNRTTQFIDTELFKIGVIDGAIKNVRMATVVDTARDTVIEDFWSTFTFNNLQSYQFFLNNKPLTDKPILISANRQAEHLVEFIKSQRINLDQFVFGSENLVLANRQVIGSRFDRATNDEVISSIRDEANNEITVDVQFSSTGAANTTYIFVNTDQRIKLLGNGQFEDVAVKPASALLSTSST